MTETLQQFDQKYRKIHLIFFLLAVFKNIPLKPDDLKMIGISSP